MADDDAGSLLQIRDLLSPLGSVWLHLDDEEVHRAHCILDEVFGADRFVATVIWQKLDRITTRIDDPVFVETDRGVGIGKKNAGVENEGLNQEALLVIWVG